MKEMPDPNGSENESKEFWRGHSFQDKCPNTKLNLSLDQKLGCMLVLPMAVEMALDVYSYKRLRKKAFEDLRKWLPLAPDAPIKTLGEESDFNITNYPTGTIFKFSQTLVGTIGKQESTRVNWGVSAQRIYNKKLTDQVMSFAEEDGKLIPSWGASATLTSGIIGDVTHEKDGLTRYQSLSRVNWVEVWQFGIGVRQEESQKVGILKRGFRRARG